MKSKILIVVVLAALLLSACLPAQTSTSNESAQSAAASEPAGAEAPQTAGETAEPPVVIGEPMPGCRVTGSQLEPNPTLVALFPAVTENDWVIGPSDARVTILEFSDFQ
jgi:protein-disulfide isomerase